MKIESINFTMDNEIECPDCHKTNTYKYDSDTTTFNHGRGVVNTTHHCKDCDSSFRLHTNFTDQIN